MIVVTLAAVAIFLIVQSLPAFGADSQSASLLTTEQVDDVAETLRETARRVVGDEQGDAERERHRHELPTYKWLNENLGWIPLFSGQVLNSGRTILTAALVLAVMVVPIKAEHRGRDDAGAPEREHRHADHLPPGGAEGEGRLLVQHRRLQEDLAADRGDDRHDHHRDLPLGRALGETMAVAMVLSATNVLTLQLLTSQNPSTIAANIALTFPEAYALNINVLIATGLILFIVTFAVNAVARWIVSRRRRRPRGSRPAAPRAPSGAGDRRSAGCARGRPGGPVREQGRWSCQFAPENSLRRLTIQRATALTAKVTMKRMRPVAISSMLGLGRALGETMAVAMVLSATNVLTLQLLT
jgi:phosphate transport system permease protein